MKTWLRKSNNNLNLMLQMNYAKIEQRVLSSKLQGKDLHTIKASDMFGVSELEVTPIMRKIAKSKNFLELYTNKEKF